MESVWSICNTPIQHFPQIWMMHSVLHTEVDWSWCNRLVVDLMIYLKFRSHKNLKDTKKRTNIVMSQWVHNVFSLYAFKFKTPIQSSKPNMKSFPGKGSTHYRNPKPFLSNAKKYSNHPKRWFGLRKLHVDHTIHGFDGCPIFILQIYSPTPKIKHFN